jgi:hypothetical protein
LFEFLQKVKIGVQQFFYHMSLVQQATVIVYFLKEKIVIVNLVKVL